MKITNKYVFFWSGIYSQWYKADMIIDGVKYNCCEQYMMHQKALLFNDYEIAAEIMKTDDPKKMQDLGRQVKNFDKKTWDIRSFGIVYKGNYEKFTQNEELKDEMLTMGKRIYVEASPKDQIWGIGVDENHEGIDDPLNWNGLNQLGFALTVVKTELRTQSTWD